MTVKTSIKNRILLKIHECPDRTTRDLADALHMDHRKLVIRLNQLKREGLVEGTPLGGKRYSWSLTNGLPALRRSRQERREQVLGALQQEPATTPELSVRLGIARWTVHQDIAALLDAQKIRRVGMRGCALCGGRPSSVWGAVGKEMFHVSQPMREANG
jgi:predicted transcriptional regulator